MTDDEQPAGDPFTTLATGGSMAGAVTGVIFSQAYLAGACPAALAIAGALLGSCVLALTGVYLIEPACLALVPRRDR